MAHSLGVMYSEVVAISCLILPVVLHQLQASEAWHCLVWVWPLGGTIETVLFREGDKPLLWFLVSPIMPIKGYTKTWVGVLLGIGNGLGSKSRVGGGQGGVELSVDGGFGKRFGASGYSNSSSGIQNVELYYMAFDDLEYY